MIPVSRGLVSGVLVFTGIALGCTQSVQAQLAIKGDLVYTMKGEPIRDGVVLVKGKRIERVGVSTDISIPADYRVLSGKVVTPGLIDARSVVGLAGMYNYPHDQSQLEKSDPMQPELRAVDAYNPREPLVEWVRNLGVTTMNTGHAPGALASGTTIVVKTVGNTVQESLVDSTGMVAFTLGSSVSSNFKTPGTSSKSVAMLRTDFLRAREYLQNIRKKDAEKRPPPDLKLEMLARVLQGEVKALVTANRATDIMTALRLQKEFGFRMVLDGAAESYLLLKEIEASGVPLILHPTMARHYGDLRNVSFETAAHLQKAGILFAIQSGYESYVPRTRIVLYEAAIAVANGLPVEHALASITLNAAQILGLERRLGSLETGKDADIVLFDGDPFEYATHVCGVVVDGTVVSETCR